LCGRQKRKKEKSAGKDNLFAEHFVPLETFCWYIASAFFLLSLFATAQKVTQNAAADEKKLKINE
jgi:hypothetical protein